MGDGCGARQARLLVGKARACQDRQEAEDKAPTEGFVVSHAKGSRVRRLHFMGGCWRIPGVHYHRYVSYGQEMPPPSAMNARCRECFPPAAEAEKAEVLAEPEDSDDSGTTSSSDSSS